MRSTFFGFFGVSMLSAMVALSASDAAAAYTRSFSPISCIGTPENSGATGRIDSNGQMINPNSSFLFQICPVVSDAGGTGNVWFPGNATSVTLHGWSQGAHTIRYRECRTYSTGGGGSCGSSSPAFQDSVGVGVEHLTHTPSSAWSSGTAEDSYYIQILLGPAASIFGYSFSHT